MKTYTSRTTCH